MQDVFPSKKDRTVRIDWKLPARLRKPIGEQLKKERIIFKIDLLNKQNI